MRSPSFMNLIVRRVLLVLWLIISGTGGPWATPPIAYSHQPLSAFSVHPQGGGRRVALIIGNSAYQYHDRLKNPYNDALGMAEALTGLGFEVAAKTNLTKAEMDQAVREFGSKIEDSEVGLFYYAGHGVQINGHNYLIPVDASIAELSDIEHQSLDVDSLYEAMRNVRTHFRIIILDACRDNPFRGLKSSNAALRDIAPGLAPPSGKAPGGTLIAYSTEPGRVASDGSGKHSPYTRALLRYVRRSGLKLEDFFKRVRESVVEDTDGEQTPWENTSISGDLYFRPPAFVEFWVEVADDQVFVFVNDAPVVTSGGGDNRWTKTFLTDATNSLEIKVYNQRSRRGVFGPREGWKYVVKLRASGQERVFAESEDDPPDERWGKTFTRVKATISVDEDTGIIKIKDVN